MRKVFSTALIVALAATSCTKSEKQDSNFKVNESSSVAEWKGSATDHFHIGSFQVKGSMKLDGEGELKTGSFVIPISSIKNFDLPETVKPQLLNHLLSPDFFNVALHPNAEFKITKLESYTGKGEGVVPGANKLVTGDFSMIGQTHPISFPAKIKMEGDSLKVESTLKLDRSKWGMTKYTTPGTIEYIIPEADIHLKMAASKI